jgi:hypothetical protein
MGNSFTTTPSSASPSGVYCSLADVQIEMGTYNEQVAADPDNAGDQTQATAHEQAALDFADSYINAELTSANFTTPAVASLNQLRFIAAKIAAYQLYQVRGLQDKNNAFQKKFDWATTQLQELIFQNRGGFTHSAGYSDSPVAVPATVDADGRPVSTITRVPFFNGLYWQW